ncbi:MAG TPA: alpha amylase family protein [bacterium]|nr:alpha amylase family protein [bacterium]
MAALVTGLAGAAPASAARAAPPRLALWMEPGANLAVLSTLEGVRQTLDQARQAGVDVVIPEAKNAWGYVTYPSAFAPTIDASPILRHGFHHPPLPQGYPEGFDMLGTIVREAHARGMRVDAAVNTFNEGFSRLQVGPAFDHPEWQATAYLGTRPVIAPDGTSYDLAGVDIPRAGDALVLYTPAAGATTPTSRWGTEVAVASGEVTEVRDRAAGDTDPGPTPIPAGGYVLSGHGAAAGWLARALPVGANVAIGPIQTRMAPSSAHSPYAFVNPADPEVSGYEMAVIYEVLSRYDVDGIILDRARYQDITEDFSPLSRAGFEAFIGQKVGHWPEDIYTYAPSGYWVTRVSGPLYRAWLGYRAHTILAYVRAVAHLVHTFRPQVAVAMYVGAWYPVYYDEGVNWASPEVAAPYAWIGPEWVRAGLAPLLDYLMIGLYYQDVTAGEARASHHNPEVSVQGGALLARSLVQGATPLVGSLQVSLYAGDPGRLTRAVRMSQGLTRGTMLFDLVYLTQDDLWNALPRP